MAQISLKNGSEVQKRSKAKILDRLVKQFFATRFALWAVFSGLLFLTGCQPENQYQEPPPPTVTVARPVFKTVVESLHHTGTTEPINLVEIRARVEGYLEGIEFQEGQQVEAGELLFTIDPRPFEATLAQAKASVKLAEAGLTSAEAHLKGAQAEVANAEAQYARSKRAAASGAVTQAELDVLATEVLTARASVDGAEASIKSSQAEITAAQAMVVEAELNLDYTKIRAPIRGRVGRRRSDIGNLVGAGESTLLTNLVQYDPIYAFFTINENDLLQLMRRRLAEKKDTDPTAAERDTSNMAKDAKLDHPIFIGLGDEEGYPHEGRAEYADLAVEQSTGTYLIRAEVPNPDQFIPPGAFIRVQVPIGEIDAILVDERAIGRDQGGAYLLVVDSDNTVVKQTVKLRGEYHGLRAVEGSLGPEDRIIVKGIQRARPGAKVNPQELTGGNAQMSGEEGQASPPAESE
ncbi:MAG: efflux transporter periplasmic adaptor subunit [Planctomycetaceae bacterium]|nr:efflux transporter periplasmic adaptor subunit [Planctomycetaceae bacterium]HCK42750.1 efflux RND transporter periplasmic adaptor subunit [Planctomycetaceae bacterium]